MTQVLQPRIELLSIALLDQHRPLVEELWRLAGALRLEFGWHYLLDLTWDRVDLEVGVITAPTSKSGQPLVTPISTAAVAELRRLPRPHQRVFCNRDGGGYEYVVNDDRCIGCGFCSKACPCGIWNLVENDPLT